MLVAVINAILVYPVKLEVYILVSPNLHRGSYMSAHGLLDLLNELGKSDKMPGLPSIL